MSLARDIMIAKAFGGGGGGGGGLLINVEKQDDLLVCDKTAGEMVTALDAGSTLIFKKEVEGEYTYSSLYEAYITPGSYYTFQAGTEYEAESADDYPSAIDK